MKIQRHSWGTELIVGLFIFLFAYTAISKLADYRTFAALLSQSPLIGATAPVLSWVLPLVETIITFLLFFPSSRPLGMILTTGLMSLFTLYVAYMLLFVSELPCSCGGVLATLSWKEHLLFNLVATALAIWALRNLKRDKRFIAINRLSRTPV